MVLGKLCIYFLDIYFWGLRVIGRVFGGDIKKVFLFKWEVIDGVVFFFELLFK